jgi:Ca-activated chloride channel family protein
MRLLPDGFQFEQPHWFWGLLLIPILALLKSAAGKQSVVQFGSLHLLQELGRRTTSALGPFGLFLTFLTIATAVTALARPQVVTVTERPEESGVEIYIALDLSFSMSIEDMFYEEEGRRVKVDRLTVAKNVTKKFIRERKADRLGFVVFSGKPYIASPLTLDTEWLEKTLEDDINFHTFDTPGDRGFQSTENMGTAIGSAIACATSRLAKKRGTGTTNTGVTNIADNPASKVIILITDGANNSGKISPLVAAKEAAERDIRIYTVAIGTHGNYVVPELVERGMIGDIVRQEYDEETLKEVAKMSNGRFYHAKDAKAMSSIFNEIDQLEKKKVAMRRTTHVDEFYHWPLWGALASAMLGIVLHQTLLRRYP